MKFKIALSFIVLVSLQINAYGQMSGAEQVVAKQLYTGNFYVNGDKDTYYPVIFKYGNQDKINHIIIHRSYNEAGPNELSPTHKGQLTLEIDANYGGWGGSTYDWRIMDLRQTYHITFAGATFAMHNYGFVVWLRGGGFLYHYESDKEANLQVAYSSSELIYDNSNNAYDSYAPEPRSTPNTDEINAHKNDHWGYLKGTATSGSNWNMNGNDLYHEIGNIGIGTSSPSTKLHLVSDAISGGESIFKIQVGDAVNDFFQITNATGIDNQFIPMLRGYRQSDNRMVMLISGEVSPENDNGNNPVVSFDARKTGGMVNTRPLFEWKNYTTQLMLMDASGNLGIGTSIIPNGYKLAVDGKIRAREIKVDTDTWSDFVFQPNYNLRTLEETEQFINKNGHLPDIPSAKQVEEEGISVGEMNAKLLQKIEELTLYNIEMNKKLEMLLEKNEVLEKEIEFLKISN